MARRKPVGAPGPAGSIVVPAGTKLSGLAHGMQGPPRTGRQLAALRRTGKRQKGAAMEAALVKATGDAKAPAVLRAFLQAEAGDLSALNVWTAEQIGRVAFVLQGVLAEVSRDGAVAEESIYDGEGRVVSRRKRESAAFGILLKLAPLLGLDVHSALLSKRSRGEAKKDESISGFLESQSRLRASLALNEPVSDETRRGAIDSEAVS